ncbi:hypothetical protein [Rhodococcoides yunnanense]|uniref:hypothetical protein n=1 Tax=Rhodococcoides yunnanense TaxID=278209 RepID=UPI001FE3A44D|nr:hypothetical protein [Rhodococcus yunnanensis]
MAGVPTSTIAHTLSRRTAFRLTGGVVLTTVALATGTGCSTGDDSDTSAIVDTLTVHLRSAQRDAAAAGALIALAPEMAGPLGIVQSERDQHAVALGAEIDRVAGVIPGETTTATSVATAEPAPPPTLEELRSLLGESQRGAANSAREESGYRAGLLGSISAACAVQVSVVLA